MGERRRDKSESGILFRCRFGAIWSAPVFFLSQLILSFTPINQDRVSPNKNSLHSTFLIFTETLLNFADERRTTRGRVPEKKCLYPIFPGDECEIPGQLATAHFHFHRKSTSIDQMKNSTLRFIVCFFSQYRTFLVLP